MFLCWEKFDCNTGGFWAPEKINFKMQKEFVVYRRRLEGIISTFIYIKCILHKYIYLY